MKRCSKCREYKPVEQFSKSGDRKDGLDPQCKNCKHACYLARKDRVSEAGRQNYLENGELIRQRNRESYQRNRERRLESRRAKRAAKHIPVQLSLFKWVDFKPDYNQRYQKENRERIRANEREYRARNAGIIAAREREYRLLNLERKKAYHREWQKKNAEKIAQYGHERRARKRGSGGSFTARDWAGLKKTYAYTCLCCGRPEPEIKLTPDHVIPLSKGGSNSIENIQPLCLSCNCAKKAKDTDYRPK